MKIRIWQLAIENWLRIDKETEQGDPILFVFDQTWIQIPPGWVRGSNQNQNQNRRMKGLIARTLIPALLVFSQRERKG
jgi:hypothetical protein